jgi:3',5'-cyclic-AMP phosphodiesterase
MLIAQITDTHIRPRGKTAYGRVPTNAMLEAAVAQIARLKPLPDVVLVTGDLTDCGLVEEYEVLREILAPLPMPVYLVPGNHDRRENLRRVFGHWPYLSNLDGFIQYAVEDFPVRLLAVDSVVPGEGWGSVCQARRDWLTERLEEGRSKPTVVFMHHPPFRTGLSHMDDIHCRDGHLLQPIIAAHPNVERVMCGHHHRPIQLRWAGTIGSVCPSTAHQVMLDLAPHDDATFTMEPAAFQLHAWIPDTGLVTHTVPVGDYGGPYPFVLDPNYPAYRG